MGVAEGASAAPDTAAAPTSGQVPVTGSPSLVVPADPEAIAQATFHAYVQSANQDFYNRVADALNLPVQVLIEQRDGALAELARQGARAQVELQRVTSEHERFVAFLMEEQLANLRHVRDQLDAAREELQRYRTLVGSPPLARPMQPTPAATPLEEIAGSESGVDGDTKDKVEHLRTELEAAYAEIDETRAEALRLQDERDEAIRHSDDIRIELQSEIDRARDETFEVQTQLDALSRQLDDARDEARDEAMSLTEEIDELRRQLDERTEEVRRLRERLGHGEEGEVQHSRPPPAGPTTELGAARREIKWLRQQLIEAKRQVSKSGPQVPRPIPRKANRGPEGRTGAKAELDRETSPAAERALQASKVPDIG
jgi:chromosome segregation ATPase